LDKRIEFGIAIMIDNEQEEQILQLAIDRGLIAKMEVQQLDASKEEESTLQGQLCWGIRLDRLLQKGRLSQDVIEALAHEIQNVQSYSRRSSNINSTKVKTIISRNDSADTLHLPSYPSALEMGKSTADEDDLPLRGIFPVSDWDRYVFIRILGEGGMGTVYQAMDPRLNRFVALKFIRGDNPRLVKRFVQEAKAQARIDHEHVCKVYEVGEVEGKPYIAMQYINGESVQAASSKMSVEQKVSVIRDAADALNAAHRLGIIHRDIKPANIMVERGEDGCWSPQVMDFGLARDLDAGQGLTETGVIMGTPSYMAPEQAKGEVHKLDRRADVYSLGATLYEMLTDKPPFEGSNFETLTKVINEDPEPLRKIAPNIPKDLETITMKCLEKDPQMRYDSCKSLADDLERFLDGDLIFAQQSSWSYRIAKQVRKHKATVSIAAIAFTVVLFFIGIAIHERYTADRNARIAQLFGQEAERIEGILQRAYLLPMHDIRSEQTLVKTRMDEIRSMMDQVGRIGTGAGYYALGRGYLALHEYEQAKTHFELARSNGYQSPDILRALGQVLGHLYRKNLEEAERYPSRELREARKNEIIKLFQKPALQYLNDYVKTDAAQKEELSHVEGQIAFYKKDYETALKKAREAYEQAPWLYDAKKLEADVYLELGKDKANKGDYDGAIQDYNSAGVALERASEVGRSDAMVYASEAERWLEIMEVERRRGRTIKDAFERVLFFCDKALQISPDSVAAYNRKSRSYWRWGEYQDRHGEDPRLSLDKAVEMSKKALENCAQSMNPQEDTRDAYENMSNAYRRKGEYEMRHSLDPKESFDWAIDSINKAIKLDPNHINSYNTLGLINDSRGLNERNRGGDPHPSWDEAIKAHSKSIELNSEYAGGYNNLGIIYVYKAQFEIMRGQDAGALLDLAQVNYEKAIKINPNLANGYVGLGQINHNRGLYKMRSGKDPRSHFDEAIENFKKAIQLNPNNAYSYNNLSYTYELKARYELGQGNDPSNILNHARAILEQSLKIDPSDSFCYSHTGMIELVAGMWAIRRGQSPVKFFDIAEKSFQKAIALDTLHPFFYQAMAELKRQEAEWLLKSGGPTRKEIDEGLKMIGRSLELNSNNSNAIALQGSLYLLQSKAERDPAIGKASAIKSVTAFESAFQSNKLLVNEFGTLLSEAQSRIK
jgi:eukaryotic-like serine/threonine-protein kinase